MGYLYLTIAIISEVIATSALKPSEGFTNLVPSIIAILGYMSAFYFLSLVLKFIPIGVAYAIWAGLGIVLIGIIGTIVFNQKLDMPAVIGMTLIVIGVVVINLFSKTATH